MIATSEGKASRVCARTPERGPLKYSSQGNQRAGGGERGPGKQDLVHADSSSSSRNGSDSTPSSQLCSSASLRRCRNSQPWNQTKLSIHERTTRARNAP